ncbi:MAG: hypothetical protein JO061_15675 [Acidobacteriaceae bacterium]|nr:hypothetical protein [Acidobacteriaceae bacterium]
MRLLIFCALITGSAGVLGGSTAPKFNKDIAPILYQNCAGCHRPGEVAPFSLLSYEDAAKRASLIATVTKARIMPPWKPELGYGDFKDARRLTDEQITLIQKWAASHAPEGDGPNPTPPTFTNGWQIGRPDKVVTMPAKFSVPADGPDQYRCFVIPMNLDKDVYISAVEFRPDDRRVVHHAIVFIDPRRQGRKLAEGSPDGSYSCFGGPGFAAGMLGGWAPGFTPAKPVEGYSTPLAKDTDLVVQIHYHPSGKPEQDQSSLGIFYGDAPTRGRTSVIISNRDIDIQPGDAHYLIKAALTTPSDAELLRITPHAHYLCKEMKIDAHLPDGSVKPLIWIKDWDFNWQNTYTYKNPIALPKGTRIEMEYTYDNSAANPRNPAHPPVHVTYGEQTTDEMGLAFLTFSLPTPAEALRFRQAMYLSKLALER